MSLSWNGMLRVELTGAETERSLSAINERHIPLFHVDRSGELTVSFWIRRGDYRKVSALCNKRGDKLSVLQRRGFTGQVQLCCAVLC